MSEIQLQKTNTIAINLDLSGSRLPPEGSDCSEQDVRCERRMQLPLYDCEEQQSEGEGVRDGAATQQYYPVCHGRPATLDSDTELIKNEEWTLVVASGKRQYYLVQGGKQTGRDQHGDAYSVRSLT